MTNRLHSKRLRLKPGEVIDHLPLILLRKYIAYARRYVHPKLSTEAANNLRDFYLELRHQHQGISNEGAAITTRQLEACIRLTQVLKYNFIIRLLLFNAKFCTFVIPLCYLTWNNT